jgi:RNA polymerase sigma-70 factor (ECF subfamily)
VTGREEIDSADDQVRRRDAVGDAGATRAATARADRSRESDLLTALLPGIAGGDRAAFADLYDRTSARVYGLVLRVVRDPGYAEEVTQEVYLQVWRGARDFDPNRGTVLAWLLTLAHRRAVDRVRAEQAATDRNDRYESRNLAAAFDTVAEEVSRRDERRSVRNCLDTLTETQRESVALAYYEGRTYPEVAARLGVALPTVKSRIRDGLIRLRRCLEVS